MAWALLIRSLRIRASLSSSNLAEMARALSGLQTRALLRGVNTVVGGSELLSQQPATLFSSWSRMATRQSWGSTKKFPGLPVPCADHCIQ